MASNKLYLGSVAKVDGSAMTIVGGKQLLISSAPTSDNSVVNKKYITDAVQAVQDSVNLITADSGVNFDTLKEVKDFAQSIRDTGVSTVTAAIDAETAARIAADDVLTAAVSAEVTARSNADATLTTAISDEVTARSNAISDEATARSNAISDEATARSNADATLTTAISAEVTARSNAVSAEATARSNADATLTTAISDEVTARSNAVSAEAATRTAEDAKLDMLAIKSSRTMLFSPTVYADSSISPKPLELCSYITGSNAGNFDGWRMRNDVAGKKFNFYVPSNGLKVGDIKAMYLELCAPSVVSMPFITIYTNKKNDGLDFSWYRSKKTYVCNGADTLVAGSNYNMVVNLKGVDTFNPAYFIRHNTILDPTGIGNKNTDNMQDTDTIMFFAIGSDSGSSVGNVECIISKFKVQLESGINEFVFSNTHIFAEYMKQKQIQLWRSLFGTSSTDNPFMSDYQIPDPDYSTR